MRQRQEKKEKTAPKFSFNNLSDYLALIVFIFLTAISSVGGVFLWLFLKLFRLDKKKIFHQRISKKKKRGPKKKKNGFFEKGKNIVDGVLVFIKSFVYPVKNLTIAILGFSKKIKSVIEKFVSSVKYILFNAKKKVFDSFSSAKKIILWPIGLFRRIVISFKSLRQKDKPTQVKNIGGQIYPQVTIFTKVRFVLLGIFLTFTLVVVPVTLYFWLLDLPNPKLLKSRDIPLTTKIYDRHGALLYQIYANQNRSFVSLPQIPKTLIQATIAIEDKNFYRHKGVDVTGIVRAAMVNIKGRKANSKILQGGSSITQQLIKSALLTPEQTFSRKIKEIVLALWAETIYSKSDILEMYFNQVPYGGTSWGVEAAAETYFKKKVTDLDLAESAMLAGLPAAPSVYSPFGAHPELAKQRQKEVLRRMREEKYITEAQEKSAISEELKIATPNIEIKAPHFVFYVKELLERKYGTRMVDQGGLSVYTTLDLKTQDVAQKIVTDEIEKLKYLLVGNGAAVVTNPKNGDVLAMVGSKDYFNVNDDGNVNVALALRQPGSSIKPIMYAAALQKGYTPSSIIDDSPIAYNLPGQPPYVPVNYDGKFHGKVTLRQALGNSFNIPAVKLLNSIGVSTMIDQARKMGISTWNDESRYGLSLTLGGGEVTMLDMATAFGVFANQGKRIDLDPILKITDFRGVTIQEKKDVAGTQVIPEEVAYQISNILADNNARMMAFGPNSSLVLQNKTVSVKTGTTNEKRDNWTIGYTPSVLVAVWVGNNNNSPMHPYLSSGITGAAPIWHDIITKMLEGKSDEQIKPGSNMVQVAVCQWNGLLPCEGCPTVNEFFVKGTEPQIHCQKITPSPTPN